MSVACNVAPGRGACKDTYVQRGSGARLGSGSSSPEPSVGAELIHRVHQLLRQTTVQQTKGRVGRIGSLPPPTAQARAKVQLGAGLLDLLGVPTGNQGPHGVVGVVDGQGL